MARAIEKIRNVNGKLIEVTLIETPALMPGRAYFVGNTLQYGKGTDLERMLFDLKLTRRDRELLEGMRVGI
jgi:hypothetical protein